MKKKEKKYRLQDLLIREFPRYLGDPNRKLYIESKHLKAVNWMTSCRTDKLGVLKMGCESCKENYYVYKSCKHRFCPTCGIVETNKWAKSSLSRLLKMKHHHVVMTLPHPLRRLSKKNGDKLHSLLFKTSSEVLQSWFSHRHNLRPGIVSVLHTSGSDLKYHPHVHMIVTGGGEEKSSGAYKELRGNYLCPQRFLGKQLRKMFERKLEELHEKGELELTSDISKKKGLSNWLKSIHKKHWIVSIQKPLEDVNQIVRYVGRYTKRCCVSEYKIEEVSKEGVSLRYNDYKNTPRGEKARESIKRFEMVDFLDNLLQHVPRKGYRMVRYYGQYSSYHQKRIPLEMRNEVEELEEIELESEWEEYAEFRKIQIRLGNGDPFKCKCCGKDMKVLGFVLKGKEYVYDSS